VFSPPIVFLKTVAELVFTQNLTSYTRLAVVAAGSTTVPPALGSVLLDLTGRRPNAGSYLLSLITFYSNAGSDSFKLNPGFLCVHPDYINRKDLSEGQYSFSIILNYLDVQNMIFRLIEATMCFVD
jgi:hypothetical protein